MNSQPPAIFIGDTPFQQSDPLVHGEYVPLLGEVFYCIRNYDAMEPFFISVVSSSDHWLFIASTGGLTAGRSSAEQAIFPYSTVDKITENSENTGAKTILLVERAGRVSLWEPFSERQRGSYAVERNLYKNQTGTALVFEEKNFSLGLTCRYAWRTSEKFGFVKTTWLSNTGEVPCRARVLDGVQNLLPANVTSQTQNIFSTLIDAYKRSELLPESGLAIFALNSTLTDLAEPSESLLATTACQVGLRPQGWLLSSAQLDRFRRGQGVTTETEVRGQRGAYFVDAEVELALGEERSWHLLIDTSQDSAAMAQKLRWLRGGQAAQMGEIEADIAAGQARLWEIVAGADGVQLSASRVYSDHHFANVMFNLMRGGTFVDQYSVKAQDFVDFVSARNRLALRDHPDFFAALPETIQVTDLQARAEATGAPELVRLSYAYLPLAFSRRHGDPSRPWNRFAINIKKPDGSLKLDYEGNWRDIFQNWEALAYSYPEFVESMIATFLNATTLDGYNPYRVTHHGLDWEIPEPGNPWANIGYWSDHQIIYLQKLMEISVQMHPGKLAGFLDRALFSCANVPYHIKPFADLLKDPFNTIDFDWELERTIETRQLERGSDGKLVYGQDGDLLRVSLAEKLLVLLLAKLSNFVPEGGIWMNTQRPEWNDANNALVGKGLSVVTLAYLRRYVAFCREFIGGSGLDRVTLSAEVQQFYTQTLETLRRFEPVLQTSFSDEQRRAMMDALGQLGSDYRWDIYTNSISGEQAAAPVGELLAFLELAQRYIEHSLRANRREDSLYHAYNILQLGEERAAVGHLYEMLEGQVAVLSSGLLSAEESLALLQSLRNSALYQPEQQTYILYPDRVLPGFMQRNCLDAELVQSVPLLAKLAAAGDNALVVGDIEGVYHFNGRFRNFKEVEQTLRELQAQPEYAALVEADTEAIQTLFEDTFHHDQFTGRSGTFFAFEGLGSVYWHMVAKLLLAAQETALRFQHTDCAAQLLDHYADIRQGLGFNKSPADYGAFPTDPYSHTPKGAGAKQPGMTGMVKEEILTRLVELGYTMEQGKIVFDLPLLDRAELLTGPAEFTYLDARGEPQTLTLEPGSLAYTICQVPVVLQAGGKPCIIVNLADGSSQTIEGRALDEATSRHIFQRNGFVRAIKVLFPIE